MAASVYELIAAANAKRDESPLISLAKALAGGVNSYQSARSNALQDQQRIVQAQRVQQEMQMAQMADQREREYQTQLKQGFNGVSGQKPGVFPTQKIEEIDKQGNVSIKNVYESDDESLNTLLLNKVKTGEMSLEDAYRLKNRSGGGVQTPPAGYRYKPDGNLEPIPGGPATQKQTESQSNSNLFGGRAAAANSLLDNILGTPDNNGNRVGGSYDPSSLASAKDKIPNAIGGNLIRSEGAQKYNQAKLDFLSAVLRKESGATIQPSEYAYGEEQYFPIAGDSPGVVEQKRQNRIRAQKLIQAGGKVAFNGNGEDAGSPNSSVTKTIGGKTYIKGPDGWYEQ